MGMVNMDFWVEWRWAWVFDLYDFENGDKIRACKGTPQTTDQ